MRIVLIIALLVSTSCASIKSRPDGATTERTIKVCIYNSLIAWMSLNLPAVLEACEETKETKEVKL